MSEPFSRQSFVEVSNADELETQSKRGRRVFEMKGRIYEVMSFLRDQLLSCKCQKTRYGDTYVDTLLHYCSSSSFQSKLLAFVFCNADIAVQQIQLKVVYKFANCINQTRYKRHLKGVCKKMLLELESQKFLTYENSKIIIFIICDPDSIATF